MYCLHINNYNLLKYLCFYVSAVQVNNAVWMLTRPVPLSVHSHLSISSSALSRQLSLCSSSRRWSLPRVSVRPRFADWTSASFCCSSRSRWLSCSSFLSSYRYEMKYCQIWWKQYCTFHVSVLGTMCLTLASSCCWKPSSSSRSSRFWNKARLCSIVSFSREDRAAFSLKYTAVRHQLFAPDANPTIISHFFSTVLTLFKKSITRTFLRIQESI